MHPFGSNCGQNLSSNLCYDVTSSQMPSSFWFGGKQRYGLAINHPYQIPITKGVRRQYLCGVFDAQRRHQIVVMPHSKVEQPKGNQPSLPTDQLSAAVSKYFNNGEYSQMQKALEVGSYFLSGCMAYEAPLPRICSISTRGS